MNIAYISVAESLGISSTTFTDGRQHIPNSEFHASSDNAYENRVRVFKTTT